MADRPHTDISKTDANSMAPDTKSSAPAEILDFPEMPGPELLRCGRDLPPNASHFAAFQPAVLQNARDPPRRRFWARSVFCPSSRYWADLLLERAEKSISRAIE